MTGMLMERWCSAAALLGIPSGVVGHTGGGVTAALTGASHCQPTHRRAVLLEPSVCELSEWALLGCCSALSGH